MRKLLWVLPWFILASLAAAVVFEPQDKSRTYTEVIMLRGRTEAAGTLEVNLRPIKIDPDRTFSCGLVLRPGKNLVEVRRGEQRQLIRVLRLVTYPDIEELYDGKKHWARGQIVYLSTLGIIEGYPDGNYYPAYPVTRGEFATWLSRVKKLSVLKLQQDEFFDVPKEHWRAPFIKAATDAGYLKGYSGETFGIDDPISRSEAAEIAVQTEGLQIIEKIRPLFVDVPQEEKGAPPIYTAREKGLVIGVSSGLPIYDPERALTRAEAATLLSRFISAQDSIRYLFDYEKGYSEAKFCGLNVAPEIISFTAEPGEINVNQVTTVKLRATIAPRANFSPISKVKVNLSQVGGMPDAEIFDDGTHGDETAGDAVYSLNILYTPGETGENVLEVTAADRLGWEASRTASLLVVE
jgi:hypothetical protein